jgi:hypothetical protein
MVCLKGHTYYYYSKYLATERLEVFISPKKCSGATCGRLTYGWFATTDDRSKVYINTGGTVPSSHKVDHCRNDVRTVCKDGRSIDRTCSTRRHINNTTTLSTLSSRVDKNSSTTSSSFEQTPLYVLLSPRRCVRVLPTLLLLLIFQSRQFAKP